MGFCFLTDVCMVIYWCTACADINMCVCVYLALFLLIETEVGLSNDVFMCAENHE